MAEDDFKLETRFRGNRGLFPYIAGILGLAVVVLAFMYLTGIGRDALPYSSYFAVRAPTAPDGSEALSLQSLKHVTDEKTTIDIEGAVMNRTDDTISGLLAVITVVDKFTLPVETVNAPVEPAELGKNAVGTFHTTVMLKENGLGSYSVNFRLPDEGPFVPHKDERPVELAPQPSEKPPSR
jgi:hypothetical protein